MAITDRSQLPEGGSVSARPWRWPTRSRLLLENAYLRDFIRAQQEKKEKAE